MIYNNVAEIYEAIDKTRDKLIARAETLSTEQENARENADAWSVAEILEHIGSVEGSIIRGIEKVLPGAESEGIKSDGEFNPPLSFLEHAKEAADKKFEAPKHAHPKSEQSIGESLLKLEEYRHKLNDLRARIEATDLSNAVFPHPAFGNLNIYQWLIIMGLHERRHLAQIDRALTK